MLNSTTTDREVTMVIEVTFAGNAVYVEVDADSEIAATDAAVDHIGHDYAGHRETYITDSGIWMVVFDHH